jgi:uncharacterized repeat protein (TIGR01451 family)
MVRNRMNVQSLLCVLPLVAGGVSVITGCESYSKPAPVTVPIGGGVGSSTSTQASTATTKTTEAKPAPKAATTTTTSTSSGSGASAAAPAPAAKPAPAAAPMGANVAYYPTGRREDAAVMIEKIAPSETSAGASTSYTIKVTNLTGTTLENVIVDEDLPQGFTFAGANPQGNAGSNGAMAWNLGKLAAGESKSIQVNGSFAKAGTYGSCATVSYTIPVCMTINVVSPSLQLTKSTNPESLLCDSWPVKLVVTNNGTGTARNVKVRDPLPAGLTTADGKNVVEFDAGNLPGGQSREFSFNVKAAKVGSYTNSANAMAEGGLTANSNSTVTEVKAPALAIDKKCPDKLFVGRPIKFDITVSNTGNAVAANTVVRDVLPQGTTLVNASEGGTASGGAVVWNLGNLAPGASKTLSLTVNATNIGAINNTASATATCAAEVTDACSTTLQGVPDIGTLITDDDGVVAVGENHTYRYEVKNQGQIDLTNVKVVMNFDSGLEYQSTNFPGGAKPAGQSVTWNVGTIKPGQIVTFSFVAKGTKEGQLVVQSLTTSDQTREVRNDEQVNYVAR